MDSQRGDFGPPFLIYWFQGFEFRFMGDYILIQDHVEHKIYKMLVEHYKENPFQITIEK